MPKLSGVFERFNLGAISPDEVLKLIPFRIEPHQLENFIGNRILYPQSIPQTKQEMELDLSILRVLIKSNPDQIYNKIKNILILSNDLVERFPPTDKLIWVLIEDFSIKGVVRIYIKDDLGSHPVGSIVSVNLDKDKAVAKLDGEKIWEIKKGSRSKITFKGKSVDLNIDNKTWAVYGGKLGIFLNL